MNLVDLGRVSLAAAYRAVAAAAEREGAVLGPAEVVGLVPQAALLAATRDGAGLSGLGPDRVLEDRLRQASHRPSTRLTCSHELKSYALVGLNDSTTAHTLAVGPVASTRMACEPARVQADAMGENVELAQ